MSSETAPGGIPVIDLTMDETTVVQQPPQTTAVSAPSSASPTSSATATTTATTSTTSTTSTAAPVDSGLSLESTPELQAVTYPTERELVVMASLVAPQWKPTVRAPIDLVAVIDRSGSMEGGKLELVKKTMVHVVEHLLPTDRISIVSFDDNIAVELPLTSLDTEGVENAKRAIGRLVAGSSTNLAGGIGAGLNQMRTNKRSEVASIIVFTDGIANVGLTSESDIINFMHNPNYNRSNREKVVKTILPCTVNTFGFGSDHDPTLLKKIAEAGNGVFYYVEAEPRIVESFANCLGGLLSVCAQNVTLRFDAINGSQIQKILTGFEVREITPNTSYELALADIQAEEHRDILVSLKIPAMLEPTEQHQLLSINVTYRDVVQGRQETKVCVCSVRRPVEAPLDQKINLKLDIQRNRLLAAEAMEVATRLANDNQLDQSRKTLSDAISRIKESASREDAFCLSLVKDLETCLAGVQDRRSYTSYGHSTMTTCGTGHYRQRVTSYGYDSLTSYTTSSRADTMRSFH
ncbi:ring zinc finger and vwf domain family protein [Pelomyxa schiedti]|nr:ring zinc finger and vwf domain family protein [Pelomyxa schiedti]